MTKEELISFLWNKAGKSKYREALITFAISRAYQQVMKETGQEKSSDLSEYSKDVKVNVLKNTALNYYYAELPFSIAQIRGPQKGVRKIVVADNNQKQVMFAPTNSINVEVLASIDMGTNNVVGYWVQGKEIRFDRAYDETHTPLICTLIPSFDGADDEDEMYIPAGKDEFFYSLVMAMLQGKQPDKELNDGSIKTL